MPTKKMEADHRYVLLLQTTGSVSWRTGYEIILSKITGSLFFFGLATD
jgi:hypothetical protein